jgi:Family of unknown function (DUF6338)
VIPGTLLGALFLAACLVPGFAFLRVAEKYRGALARSSLLEAVELAGVGAVTSLLAAMAVLGISRQIDLLNVSALAEDPGRYLLLHPFRGLGSALALFALSCGISYGAGRAMFARRESAFDPAGSTWGRVMLDGRPKDCPEVAINVELSDRRVVLGRVYTFSAELEDSRELALIGPLAISPSWDQPFEDLPGDFMLLREEQILTIRGNYIPKQGGQASADSPAAASAQDGA